MTLSKLKCKQCKEYTPRDAIIKMPKGNFCGYECLYAFIQDFRNKERLNKIKKAYGKELGTQNKIKTRKYLYDVLQNLVNQYVLHVRDKCESCCTCGTFNTKIKYDAGHFYTRAARPDIRFNEYNIHKQCSVYCNQHGSGRRLEYEKFILRKYGKEKLDELARVGKSLKEQFPNLSDIESEIIRYRQLIRENGLRPRR